MNELDICCAKKRDGKRCGVKIKETNKNIIKIDDKPFIVCGIHKNINDIKLIYTEKMFNYKEVNNMDINNNSYRNNINKNEQDCCNCLCSCLFGCLCALLFPSSV